MIHEMNALVLPYFLYLSIYLSIYLSLSDTTNKIRVNIAQSPLSAIISLKNDLEYNFTIAAVAINNGAYIKGPLSDVVPFSSLENRTICGNDDSLLAIQTIVLSTVGIFLLLVPITGIALCFLYAFLR